MIFTLDDITHLPDSDNDGWFYGVVRNDKGRLGIYEIFPGLGYGKVFLTWHPIFWWHCWRDCIIQILHKNIVRITDEEYDDREKKRHHNLDAFFATIDNADQRWEDDETNRFSNN